MERNQRKYERVHVSLDIIVESLSGKRECRISDISLGGCYVDSIATMTEGETISFKIRLPSGHWWQSRGKVAYVFRGCGFGISFNSLTREDQILLEQVIVAHGGQPTIHQDLEAGKEANSGEKLLAPESDYSILERKNFDNLTQSIQESLLQGENKKKE